ncbi:MAG: pyridoxamine 5'-phosphate oxidase family protein [Opitutae bacterium]|nr:pyridoxamine 5'-phosphate oxidase family protein [Opitutae bacterium]
MAGRYLELMFTPPVHAAQQRYYGRSMVLPPQAERDALTADEIGFIGARDSFYLGSVSPSGWPYIQHRGGAPGFLRVLDPLRLAFADYKGNRQMITTGHLAEDARVSLFLMDYPQRQRLKVLGQARVVDAREDPEALALLAEPALRPQVERLYFIDVVSYDWNCPKYITPRFTREEVAGLTAPLQARIAELEAQLAKASS